ncbi:MAG TPA: signal recognition particle-docking protein FtsY [Pyrinomonadaceae bacterium]|nr:signal recognition particle-docking protein FtsY [Pyrinomonadaceae bacterium]
MAFFWRRNKEDTFSSSILGLDKSIEELKAQEEAVEKEIGVRFSKAIEKTRNTLNNRLDKIFEGRKQIDEALLDELEEMLISTDIGVTTTMQVLEAVRTGVSRQEINDLAALKSVMKQELLGILEHSREAGVAAETDVPDSIKPYVLMVVGVNGVGKTTTIGKLAQRIKNEGNDVLICAADTFRAAASDQLEIWAERAGVPIVQQKQGTDPAAVLFDALQSAKSRSSDVLIVDTAGRLHNKANLMAELEKMKRIAAREVQQAPHETLLVIDAVTGQNGLEQARQFMRVADVTGIVLTKLDGTAKGGIAVAISKELNLPIRYVGIGEQVDDLMVFNSENYVNSLFN